MTEGETRTPRPKRDTDGNRLRQVRGRPVMVTMARAKTCAICGEPNDSNVTRSANGMFHHYRDCSECRAGSEVRDALSPPPSLRRTRKERRESNRRIHGTVIFGPNEPGVEYFEVPAPVQDWRATLKANTDEPPKR